MFCSFPFTDLYNFPFLSHTKNTDGIKADQKLINTDKPTFTTLNAVLPVPQRTWIKGGVEGEGAVLASNTNEILPCPALSFSPALTFTHTCTNTHVPHLPAAVLQSCSRALEFAVHLSLSGQPH